MDQVLEFAAFAVYLAMGLAALFGLFWTVLLWLRIKQKRFSSDAAATEFLDEVGDHLSRRDFEGAYAVCDTASYWSKAVPQLVMLATQNVNRPFNKLRKLLAEKFERDILASLEYGTSWIATIVKSAPMLGLLGTVLGMINAFAKIAASAGSGTDPTALAEDISFALATTALGLTIAIPLVLAGNVIHIRIGKLQDNVQADLSRFLDDLEGALDEEEAA